MEESYNDGGGSGGSGMIEYLHPEGGFVHNEDMDKVRIHFCW